MKRKKINICSLLFGILLVVVCLCLCYPSFVIRNSVVSPYRYFTCFTTFPASYFCCCYTKYIKFLSDFVMTNPHLRLIIVQKFWSKFNKCAETSILNIYSLIRNYLTESVETSHMIMLTFYNSFVVKYYRCLLLFFHYHSKWCEDNFYWAKWWATSWRNIFMLHLWRFMLVTV